LDGGLHRQPRRSATETFPNEEAADAFRIDIEGQLQSGIYRPDAGKLTIKQACESFITHCEGRNQRDERMTRKMLVVYKRPG
jgi:hypothetical protein